MPRDRASSLEVGRIVRRRMPRNWIAITWVVTAIVAIFAFAFAINLQAP